MTDATANSVTEGPFPQLSGENSLSNSWRKLITTAASGAAES